MASTGFELKNPASDRPQTRALNRAATEIGIYMLSCLKYMYLKNYPWITDFLIGWHDINFDMFSKEDDKSLQISLYFQHIIRH